MGAFVIIINMNLKKKIEIDIFKALKENKKSELKVLRYLLSQIKDKEIEQKRKELTDSEIFNLINIHIKKLEEGIEFFQKANRKELVIQNEQEISILKKYLPKQLSEEKLSEEIEKIINENKNITSPKILIGLAIKKLQGKTDNKRISQMVLAKLKS